jgi:site-specific DNA-methyltransferase (cytosine-N4-specific)
VDKVDRLLASIGELTPWTDTATASVVMGNADDSDLFEGTEGRRLIITSPPYATALPYIDTDRLSIVALGLAEPTALRTLEADLTGSREWNTAESKRWWTLLKANSASLPDDVVRLLADLVTANEETGAGFRRAAVPPLLYRYFSDMRDCFTSWAQQLRPGEFAVVVVGRNRTGPAGAQTLIDTPTLLGTCARQVGFDVADQILLETWPRFGLHAANGVQGEDALVLRRT